LKFLIQRIALQALDIVFREVRAGRKAIGLVDDLDDAEDFAARPRATWVGSEDVSCCRDRPGRREIGPGRGSRG